MSLSPLKSSQTAPQPSTTHMQPSLAFATYQTRSPLAPTCMHAYTLSNQINQSWLISVHATHYTQFGTSFLISRLLCWSILILIN